MEQAIRYARGQKIVELLRAGRLKRSTINYSKDLPWTPYYVALPDNLERCVRAYYDGNDPYEVGLSYLTNFFDEDDLYDCSTGTFIHAVENYRGYRPILEKE